MKSSNDLRLYACVQPNGWAGACGPIMLYRVNTFLTGSNSNGELTNILKHFS